MLEMRIALIHTPFWARGGGERQILRLAIELQRLGHEVEIFTNAVNEAAYPEFFSKVKINVVPHPLTGRLPSGLAPQIATRKITAAPNLEGGSKQVSGLRRWMSEVVGRQFYTSEVPAMFELGRKIPKGFDVLNNHNFPTEWAGLYAKARLKVPLVWMCNEPPFWFFSSEQRAGLRKINWPLFEILDRTAVDYVDEIMVLSHVAEGYVKNAYNRSSRVVRTGVDVEFFHRASGERLREKYNLGNSFVMLFVGGTLYAKRAYLVKALHLLSKKYSNVKLIFDSARERNYLTNLAASLGVKDKVIFLQSKTDTELAEAYAACDAFIFPSTSGTWGLVVTEAMAAGKPVVTSRQVGVSEIIEDGKNGILIDNAGPEEIAGKVELLINDAQLRKTLGENAYRYVSANFSWEKYARTVEGIFKRTLDQYRN
jgi:glycosyltransferase involved in cell wall biosynthesis